MIPSNFDFRAANFLAPLESADRFVLPLVLGDGEGAGARTQRGQGRNWILAPLIRGILCDRHSGAIGCRVHRMEKCERSERCRSRAEGGVEAR